jgi:hypothetical protein
VYIVSNRCIHTSLTSYLYDGEAVCRNVGMVHTAQICNKSISVCMYMFRRGPTHGGRRKSFYRHIQYAYGTSMTSTHFQFSVSSPS